MNPLLLFFIFDSILYNKRSVKRLHTYSQHFLRSPRFVAELIGHSSIRPRDLVIDIGAGSGTITSVLARRARSVIAIEPEPKTARTLKSNMTRFSNVMVIEQDFLRYTLPNESYKVFANIPFHLSSEILDKLITADRPPRAIYVIVQKQFARKLLASGKFFTSQTGMAIAPWWSARIRRPLKKTDFWPHPAVDTVLLEIKPRETPLLNLGEKYDYENFVKECFENPRYFRKVSPSDSLPPSRLSVDSFLMLYKTARKNFSES